jgi:hypothetical protein
MDMYLFWTNNKSLTHGTQLQSTPWTLDHSAVTTFFEIKRSYNTSSTYNHQPEHALHENCGIEKQGCSHPRPSLALSLPPPGRLIVYMKMGQNLSLPNFKNFFNHMEFDPN